MCGQRCHVSCHNCVVVVVCGYLGNCYCSDDGAIPRSCGQCCQWSCHNNDADGNVVMMVLVYAPGHRADVRECSCHDKSRVLYASGRDNDDCHVGSRCVVGYHEVGCCDEGAVMARCRDGPHSDDVIVHVYGCAICSYMLKR